MKIKTNGAKGRGPWAMRQIHWRGLQPILRKIYVHHEAMMQIRMFLVECKTHRLYNWQKSR
jgi:hypothetical protein